MNETKRGERNGGGRQGWGGSGLLFVKSDLRQVSSLTQRSWVLLWKIEVPLPPPEISGPTSATCTKTGLQGTARPPPALHF